MGTAATPGAVYRADDRLYDSSRGICIINQHGPAIYSGAAPTVARISIGKL